RCRLPQGDAHGLRAIRTRTTHYRHPQTPRAAQQPLTSTRPRRPRNPSPERNRRPMLHFDSDYLEGTHPAILERMLATNLDQTPGYGTDEVCAAARERIREACACPHAAVHFLVGGTQANAAVADQILRPWEGIVSATTGHITAH